MQHNRTQQQPNINQFYLVSNNALRSNKLSIAWIQYQTRVRKDVTDWSENERSFSVNVGIISFTFNEALLCQKFSLYCFCCATALILQTPLVVLIDIYFEIDNKNTDSASYNDYFVYALHC